MNLQKRLIHSFSYLSIVIPFACYVFVFVKPFSFLFRFCIYLPLPPKLHVIIFFLFVEVTVNYITRDSAAAAAGNTDRYFCIKQLIEQFYLRATHALGGSNYLLLNHKLASSLLVRINCILLLCSNYFYLQLSMYVNKNVFGISKKYFIHINSYYNFFRFDFCFFWLINPLCVI